MFGFEDCDTDVRYLIESRSSRYINCYLVNLTLFAPYDQGDGWETVVSPSGWLASRSYIEEGVAYCFDARTR